MVLASSNIQDTILDPFAGSGTTLRVCQQLDRHSIGIELNNEYVELIRNRLKQPFRGFDSVDPRMKRIPNDLNDATIREEYRKKHKLWFLKNHQQEHSAFDEAFRQQYCKVQSKVSLTKSRKDEVQHEMAYWK